jgi:hypothetical protein
MPRRGFDHPTFHVRFTFAPQAFSMASYNFEVVLKCDAVRYPSRAPSHRRVINLDLFNVL